MINIKLKGMDQVRAKFDEAMREVNNVSEEMMVVMLSAISANTAPYVPVDTSALINSEVRSVRFYSLNGAMRIAGSISYGADGSVNSNGTPVQDYAMMIHEGPQNMWQKPTASNRFLTKGFEDFIQEDLNRIIQAYSS